MSGFVRHGAVGGLLFGGIFFAVAVPGLTEVGRLGVPVWPWALAVLVVGLGLSMLIASGGDEAAGCLAVVAVVVGTLVGGWVGRWLSAEDVTDPRAKLIGTLTIPALVLVGYVITVVVVVVRERRPKGESVQGG